MTARRLRAVVVDDSALARLMVRQALLQAGGVTVVGVAGDGNSALDAIGSLDPDLVTLDVEMPNMNGIQVLRKLRDRGCRARVVMVSRHTIEGAAVTTEALLEGAFDFLAKPQGTTAGDSQQQLLGDLQRILPAVRESLSTGSELPAVTQTDAGNGVGKPCEFALIGTSTGGPAALRQLLPELPHDFAAPIAIVQHMPAGGYTERLAARLDEMTHFEVVEGRSGLAMRPGRVVVAPGGRHMGLTRRGDQVLVKLSDDPPEHRCRPAFDYLLRTASDALAERRTVVVVLTGMGCDGTLGAKLLRARGGQVLAQHAEGCAVYGMPRAVIDAGHADRVIRLSEMAAALGTTTW